MVDVMTLTSRVVDTRPMLLARRSSVWGRQYDCRIACQNPNSSTDAGMANPKSRRLPLPIGHMNKAANHLCGRNLLD